MLVEYLELMPIMLVGLVSGFVGALDGVNKEGVCNKEALKEGAKKMLVSTFVCVVAFSILSATELPYLAKVGISAVIGFLGFDRAISLVKELIALKSGKG
ncbi:phage holin family protein [Helicobacter sp. WB40]|uniref:phage holin family protein n=1 Tax=Helicobacter sp. WB40 TaxID=3004130 RepID=UPI0022EBEA8E|nr:phage holin family protein [Helicobacter sp. WB40]MDA3967368.1 hypothetical protein [Helicobacter sp. WB40]